MTRWTRTILVPLIAALGISVTPAVAAAAPVIETSSTGASFQVYFHETFDRGNVGMGGWDTSAYPARLSAYDDHLERNIGPVRYEDDYLTVQNSHLRMWAHSRPNADGTWTPYGAGVTPLIGGKFQGIKYGRVSFALGVYPQGSAGMENWWFAGLQWPEPKPGFVGGDHCDGELDWPEMVPGETAHVYQHLNGTRATPTSPCSVNPQDTCFQATSGPVSTYGWHEYAMERLPSGTTYFMDGKVIGASNCSHPEVDMMLKLQTVTLNKQVGRDSHGYIDVDDIKVSRYVGR
jgi:hypothetical protein